MKTTQKQNRLTKLHKQVRHHTKMALVPHKANQYRPHLVRGYGIGIVLLLIAVTLGGYNYANTGSVLGVQTSITSSDLLSGTNSQRSDNKLAPLALNAKLSQAATLKADDMFKQQYWAHIAPDGTTPWHWFDAVGYDYSYAGENLAKNFTSTNATMAAWMASPEHRANILGQNYTDVGFAIESGMLQGQNTVLVVALFGSTQATTPTVAGTQTNNVSAAPTHGISLITRIGIAIQSLSPAAIGSILLIIITVIVAFAAHAYRRKLPKNIQKTWRRHHGIVTVAGMLSLLVTIVALYSGGQI